MNFKKLQTMQLELDNSILSAKPKMTAEERFNKTLVALSVEVAKMADCAEHFKFWKDNKGKVDEKRFWTEDEVEYYDKLKDISLDFEQAHKRTLVEEASDCLHFILSLTNQSSMELEADADFMLQAEFSDKEEIYLDILWCIAEIWTSKQFNINLIGCLLVYFGKLGITTQELEQASYEKNEENYRRLREGY